MERNKNNKVEEISKQMKLRSKKFQTETHDSQVAKKMSLATLRSSIRKPASFLKITNVVKKLFSIISNK